jgi:hypothetical protein
MYDQAIDKLRDEMAAHPNDGTIQHIGNYLTDYLKTHKGSAEAILQEGKTLQGGLKTMEEFAGKNKIGNMVVIDPETGYGIIMNYFGITGKPEEKPKTAGVCGFAPDLDDLLGD